MQLSRAHVVPRTLREGAVSETSTSWLDALDHPKFRETTRHVRLDCPYAMAVMDTVARAVAGVVGAPVSEQRDAADLQRVRAAVEGVLQLSWREAQRQERAILMWLEEVRATRRARCYCSLCSAHWGVIPPSVRAD